MEDETTDARDDTAKEWVAQQKVEYSTDELRGMAIGAKHQADRVINPMWKAAWMQLALAADHLSLMMDRSTVTAGEE